MLVRLVPLTAAAALLFAASAQAADPAVRCESGKLKTAGKYASCVLNANSRAAKIGDPADYSTCVSKLGTSWQKAEDKGAGMCPGGAGDQSSIQGFLDGCDQAVASVLAGDPPTGLFTCPSDLTTCQGDLSACLFASPVVAYVRTGQTSCYNTSGVVIPCAGTGQDGALQKGVARSFTDNGDGTVTDNATKLMWEKLSDDGTIHDKDTLYTWTDAFATKVATLNGSSFAGHNDWRVPNVTELQTLVNFGAVNPATYPAFNNGCAAACTVSTCSCTASSNVYWSSTTYSLNPTDTWFVNFNVGYADTVGNDNPLYVRAVRGGS